jgi:glutathione S-transferase
MASDSALNYVPVAEARAMPGLRVAFTRGVPGAWSVAIKAILDIKGIDYIPVPQEPGGANESLKEWTGQTSAPVLMFNDDKARPHWSEMLALAEQLQPEPRLVPVDEEDRITMLGLCHEICSEDGLGWNVRLCLLSGERGPPRDQGGDAMRRKYRSPVTTEHARQRVRAIIRALAARLDRQAALGHRYFMGDQLTAADIYWTAFSNLFSPMTADLCTMPESYRGLGPVLQLYLEDPLPQILFDHRDYVARNHFRLPIAL